MWKKSLPDRCLFLEGFAVLVRNVILKLARDWPLFGAISLQKMKPNSSAHIKAQPFVTKDDEDPVDDWSASFRSEVDVESGNAAPESVAVARKHLAVRLLPVVLLGMCAGVAGTWFAWQAWAATPARAERLSPVA